VISKSLFLQNEQEEEEEGQPRAAIMVELAKRETDDCTVN
jgi:hypothetical protein